MNKPRRRTISLAALAGLTLAATPGAKATAIGYLGSDETTHEDWRTTSVAKPETFDPNGDNAYGTDGYYTVADDRSIISSLPPYINSVSNAGFVFNGNSHHDFDDPTQAIGAPGNINSGLMYPSNDGSDFAVLSFDLLQDANFVVTIPLGGHSVAHRPTSVKLVQTGGGDASAATTSIPAVGYVGYLFFAVDGSAGDTFDVVIGGAGGGMSVAGIAFEAAASPGSSDLVMIDITSDGDQVSVTWRSRPPPQQYRVFFSTDCISWLELEDSFPSQGATTTYTDPIAARFDFEMQPVPPLGFYRAMEQ